MMPGMNDPLYAAHERMTLRGRSIPPGSADHITFTLYEQLGQHLIRTYPASGPLRSMALRRLSESLNDVLDHAGLVRLREASGRMSFPAEEVSPPQGAPAAAGDDKNDAAGAISNG